VSGCSYSQNIHAARWEQTSKTVTAHEAAAAGATLVIRILEKKFVAFAMMIAFAVIVSTELG
jgi:hypothetical protein